jgi:hypothetical protein
VPTTNLTLSHEDVSGDADDHGGWIDKVVADGADHFVEDHDRRLRADQFSQPEVDSLLLRRVRHGLESFA